MRLVHFIVATIVLATTFWPLASPHAAEARHGLSIFGPLGYSADFKNFRYVNPDAPKGGRISMVGPAGRITFDSFNNYILKGDAAQGLDALFDSLMVRAFDEPDAVYGLVAKTAEVADDGKSVTFILRPEAKFSDGSALTAEDVVFSFDALKNQGHPSFRIMLRDVEKAEALDQATVRYTFTGDLVRDLPINVATLPILSKKFYTAHKFAESSLVVPVGSGPYQISEFKAGTFVLYRRRQDYWGKDLAVNRGRFNFGEIKYEYFRDRKLFPNVDFYSGIILEAMGIPTKMFTAIFALARTVGWIAQWNEMIEDPEQKIGRPRQLYTGPAERSYVPLDRRG